MGDIAQWPVAGIISGPDAGISGGTSMIEFSTTLDDMNMIWSWTNGVDSESRNYTFPSPIPSIPNTTSVTDIEEEFTINQTLGLVKIIYSRTTPLNTMTFRINEGTGNLRADIKFDVIGTSVNSFLTATRSFPAP